MRTSDVREHDGRANGRKARRSLVTSVGVVVLLVGAIAVVNLGDDVTGGSAQSVATGDVLTGFPQTKRGAEDAAAQYAAAFGGERMFNKEARRKLVQVVTDPARRDELQAGFDEDYSADFNRKLGLDTDGSAPAGATFVSQTKPAETIARAYGPNEATVEVWCSGRLGMTGKDTKIPVTTSWFTMTMQLKWAEGDWKVSELTQRQGPTPSA